MLVVVISALHYGTDPGHRYLHILYRELSDNGCGIPGKRREEIFAPFFTTKKEGTGLGLPIAKKIIEAHKGHLELLDNPEKGVTFRVLLPIGSG